MRREVATQLKGNEKKQFCEKKRTEKEKKTLAYVLALECPYILRTVCRIFTDSSIFPSNRSELRHLLGMYLTFFVSVG